MHALQKQLDVNCKGSKQKRGSREQSPLVGVRGSPDDDAFQGLKSW